MVFSEIFWTGFYTASGALILALINICYESKCKEVNFCCIRIIRDVVVVHDGELLALKRFKDDVKDVAKGYDCGIQIKGYNDIEERDVIESYHEVAIKKKLK